MEKGMELDMGEEFASLDFNSSRLEKRFIRTMKTFASQPDKSPWYCSENRAEAKAIYRLLANERLDKQEVLRAHREATIRRMREAGGTILAVQDTSSLNYNGQSKMEGIGYISDLSLGVNIHSCLAVTAEGLVLGLLSQSSYSRGEPEGMGGTAYSKASRALEEKQSFRWVKSLGESMEGLPEDLHVVSVCDREGDMYELFDAAVQQNRAFVIRIAQNRKTVENRKIFDAIRKSECRGTVKTRIPRDSRGGVQEREAVLQVRYQSFEIKKPKRLGKNKDLTSELALWVIHVKEESPPQGTKAIEWYLMTNEPVESFQAAYEKVGWYTQRWKIERFHYVLKSGCAVEKLQERSMERTTKLVLMYSIIALSIMHITYVARIYPQLPCTVVFAQEEWKVLYCAANKTKRLPSKPPTIVDAVKYLGWLGGPKRAPSDGPPGVKTIWIGLDKLYTLLEYKEWMT